MKWFELTMRRMCGMCEGFQLKECVLVKIQKESQQWILSRSQQQHLPLLVVEMCLDLAFYRSYLPYFAMEVSYFLNIGT